MGQHGSPDADPLARGLARAHGALPDQGPIGVFIHHNTLHAFQHLPFHEAVQTGADLLDARPYPEASTFRTWLADGRIERRDLEDELTRALGGRGDEPLAGAGPEGTLTRRDLWWLLLTEGPDEVDEAGLRFLLATHRAGPLRRTTTRRPPSPAPPARRHRDALVALGADDPDLVVHPELIRLCASFLDQGQAAEVLPERDAGFVHAVARLAASGFPMPTGCPGVAADLAQAVGRASEDIVRDCLAALGVEGDEVEGHVLHAALALRGWAGMMARLERRPDERGDGPATKLVDYLAVRLMFERRAIEAAARRAGLPVAWAALRALLPAHLPPTPHVDRSVVDRVATITTCHPEHFTDDELDRIWSEIQAFPDVRRRQLWLEAYERRYRRQILDAMHARRAIPTHRPPPRLGFVFCIDEREESIRRGLEEQDPGYATWGVAGFFGLAIDYQGLDDHHPAAHCPAVVVPAHGVVEAPVSAHVALEASRRARRSGWNRLERGLGDLSRTLSGGAGLALAVGPVAGAMAAMRVFAPKASLGPRAKFDATFAPRPTTRLSAVRESDHITLGDKPLGFSVHEAADRVAAQLTNIGMVRDFPAVVVVLGHGSTSLNNPHESAHDCGACGGRRGGANARLFADVANRPDVRAALVSRGVAVPDTTWFVGGLHDTSDDSVTLYDLDAVPAGNAQALAEATRAMDLARAESARERCRRFENIRLGITPGQALAHVQGRASHLAQPRPEYGHCTNAIAVVGRRDLTRGLHLDRRAFLISYDATVDPNHNVVERILAAVGPVGAGISLEYYFSSVDNEVYGCGTKLPHNVTGLLGVMNGHQGDLRTGLPLQMVEIHEPMRLLLIVEATPAALLQVAARQAEVAELVINAWVQLVSIHPETGAMEVFQGDGFHPYTPEPYALPRVARSQDWHGQHRKHLPPALVEAALT